MSKTVTKESWAGASLGSKTLDTLFAADVGNWYPQSDTDGTPYYEVVNTPVKHSTNALYVKATYGTGNTEARCYHDFATPLQLRRDMKIKVQCRPNMTPSAGTNLICVRVRFDDMGTARQIRYYLLFNGALPADTSTNGYIDKSADFAQDAWGTLHINPFSDFSDKFKAQHTNPDGGGVTSILYDLKYIKVTRIEVTCEANDATETVVDAYYDLVQVTYGEMLISMEDFISPWNKISMSDGTHERSYRALTTEDTLNSWIFAESAGGRNLRVRALYSGGASRVGIALGTYGAAAVASGDFMTLYCKFRADKLDNLASGSTGIRYIWRYNGHDLLFDIQNDYIKDWNGSNHAITISSGTTHSFRLVVQSQVAANLYWDGSSSAISLGVGSLTGTVHRLSIRASTAATETDIELRALKIAQGPSGLSPQSDFEIPESEVNALQMFWLKQCDVVQEVNSTYTMVAGIGYMEGVFAEQSIDNCIVRFTSSDFLSWTLDTDSGVIMTAEHVSSGNPYRSAGPGRPTIVYVGSAHYMWHHDSGTKNTVLGDISFDGGVTWSYVNSGGAPVLTGAASIDLVWAFTPKVRPDPRSGNISCQMLYAAKITGYNAVARAHAAAPDVSEWTKDGWVMQSSPINPYYNALYFESTSQYYAYYTDDQSPAFSVNLMVSSDGENYGNYAFNPVLLQTEAPNWDAGFTIPNVVHKINGTYYMIYSARMDGSSEPYIGFGLASGPNEKTFQRVYDPIINNCIPRVGGVGHIKTNISFEIAANGDAIDSSDVDVEISINGGAWADVIIAGAFQTGYTGTITSDGGEGQYVMINPTSDFSDGDIVHIRVFGFTYFFIAADLLSVFPERGRPGMNRGFSAGMF